MIRNLKALGLALVAVFALSAMAASAASAADLFHAEGKNNKFTGKQDGTTNDVFTTTAGTVECNNATYEGSQAEETASEAEVTAAYSECTAFGGFAGATVHMNTCRYLFTINATGTGGTAHIKCTTPGDSITVTATSLGTTKCVVHVPEQTIGGITYTNIGSGATREITVDVSTTGMTYTHTSGTGFGACTGAGTTVQHDGKYSGKDVITGETSGGTTHTGVWVA